MAKNGFAAEVTFNNEHVSLYKVLILDRYSLLEPELQWFKYSFSIYIKQEMQNSHSVHWGINPLSKTPPPLFLAKPPPLHIQTV